MNAYRVPQKHLSQTAQLLQPSTLENQLIHPRLGLQTGGKILQQEIQQKLLTAARTADMVPFPGDLLRTDVTERIHRKVRPCLGQQIEKILTERLLAMVGAGRPGNFFCAPG